MAERVRLRAGDLEVELAPAVGGSVAAFRLLSPAGSTPLFRESPRGYRDVLQSASFPLVPFSNRVREGRFAFRGREVRLSANLPPQRHPLHGQGWRSPWSLVRADGGSAELHFEHDADEWPWAYHARQVFELDQDGLTIRLQATNRSDEPMPCGLGQHPYFPADEDTLLTASTEAVLPVDEEVMPVGRELPVGRYSLEGRRISGADLDNGYEGWRSPAEIEWPSRGVGLRISSPEATRFQVYAPPEGGLFVAEPVTNINDVFSEPEARWPELGLAILERSETTGLTARFEVVRR